MQKGIIIGSKVRDVITGETGVMVEFRLGPIFSNCEGGRHSNDGYIVEMDSDDGRRYYGSAICLEPVVEP